MKEGVKATTIRPVPGQRRRRGQRRLRSVAAIGILAAALSLPCLSPLTGQAAPAAASTRSAITTNEVLVPVGGGYTTETLRRFSRAVAGHTTESTVTMVVVPAAYGASRKERHANIHLARIRTNELQQACQTVVVSTGHARCSTRLLTIFDRNDARLKSNARAFAAPGLDGVFFLGGDQDIAMRVLAGSPVERAMGSAYRRGVVFGGSSAGDAVLSASMIYGDTATGGPATGLQKGAVRVWWSNDAGYKRGLRFGARNVIFDEHFYERGRFGRLLNIVAQSGEHFGGNTRVGVGVDFGTGITDVDGRQLRGMFGSSSTAIVDFHTAHASYRFAGASQTLSARHVVTDILARDPHLAYDLSTHTPILDGHPFTFSAPGSQPDRFRAPGRGTLILGGDVTGDPGGQVSTRFVQAASAAPGRILIVTVGYSDASAAKAAGLTYTKLLVAGGLHQAVHPVKVLNYAPGRKWPSSLLRDTRGVLFVGGNQNDLAGAIADGGFNAFVHRAVARAPAVLTDQAMTAAMGQWYVANADPTPGDRQLQAIDDFLTGYVRVRAGLDVLKGLAFEPRLTLDQRWGRLYGLAMHHPFTLPVGISEDTGLVLGPRGGTVIGLRSVVVLNGKRATFLAGDNGAFSALNVMLDIFAPSDSIGSG